jgi:peptide/nickel transport system substrate-binding protein
VALVLAVGLLLGAGAPMDAGAVQREQPPAQQRGPRHGGRLVVGLDAVPQTLNPAVAADGASLTVIRRMTADLIHVNRATQETEPALAASWDRSEDGRLYTLHLRRGVRFSDGEPFDADDVLFSFRVYLDEAVGCPQRDMLIVGGQPIQLHKIDAHTVEVELAQPYAAAERLFDSFAMLPEHLLAEAYAGKTLPSTWGLSTPPSQIAGLGPFRLADYSPAQRLVLERNPHYWKQSSQGEQLPYLDTLVLELVGNRETQVARFQMGGLDVIDRLSSSSFAVLQRDAERRGYRLYDLGPGLDFSFLFFNLNRPPTEGRSLPEHKLAWFENLGFRRAVARAVDRRAMIRLVYRGRASPLATHVTPGNARWIHRTLEPPERSLDEARGLLREHGFSWQPDGSLVDSAGRAVELSIMTSAGNEQRAAMVAIIQEDLRQLGMTVHVDTLEMAAVLQRLFGSHEYEACLLALGGGDADPNSAMGLLLSDGGTHLWSLDGPETAPAWQAEIDRLLRRQLSTMDPAQRRAMYDRVQELIAEHLPFIALVSPNVLVGARADLEGLRPAVLDHHLLWTVEELYWRPDGGGASSAGDEGGGGR